MCYWIYYIIIIIANGTERSWRFLWNLPSKERLERSTSIRKFSSDRCVSISVSSSSVHTRGPVQIATQLMLMRGEGVSASSYSSSFSRVRALHRIDAEENPALLVRSHAFNVLLRTFFSLRWGDRWQLDRFVVWQKHSFKASDGISGIPRICVFGSYVTDLCHYIICCSGWNSECVRLGKKAFGSNEPCVCEVMCIGRFDETSGWVLLKALEQSRVT